MVKASRMHSQKKPATANSPTSLGLYFTCMKNKMTSDAFTKAMIRATGRIQKAHIDEGGSHRDDGADHQGEEDQKVDLERDDVMFSVMFRH